jgi:hypothetical protein
VRAPGDETRVNDGILETLWAHGCPRFERSLTDNLHRRAVAMLKVALPPGALRRRVAFVLAFRRITRLLRHCDGGDEEVDAAALELEVETWETG